MEVVHVNPALGIKISALVILGSVVAVSAATDSPVVWLEFTNGAAATTVSDSSGNANIGTLGTNTHLVPAGGPTPPELSNPFDSVEFDGVGTNQNTVTINDSLSMDFDKTYGSVVFWVRVDNINPDPLCNVCFLKDSAYSNVNGLEAQLSRWAHGEWGLFKPFFGFGWQGANPTFFGGDTAVQAQWKHYGFTWDIHTTPVVLKWYVNGTLVTATAGQPGGAVPAPTTGNWLLGWDKDVANDPGEGNGRPLKGRMSDFAAFSVELPSNTMNKIYLRGVAGFIQEIQSRGTVFSFH